MFRDHVSRFLVTAAMIFVADTPALAGFIVQPGTVDNLFELKITWGWDPETADISAPVLTNWEVSLAISLSALGNWEGQWRARHKTDPHAGENQGGETAMQSFPFGSILGPGGPFTQLMEVNHLPTHSDHYQVTFERSRDASQTKIQLTGQHVPEPPRIVEPIPEPSAAMLFSGGLLGLLSYGWSRKMRHEAALSVVRHE